MGADKKTSKVTPQMAAQVEAETQDEIEEIMSEIESLQQGLADAPKSKGSAAKLKAVPAQPAEPVFPDTTETPETNDEDLLGAGSGFEEFRGSGEEASLEETLGDMKGEESTGTSLLDTPDDAPDASEDTAIIEAVEEEEEQEEEVFMSNPSSGDGDSALTLTLNGSMTLRLKYESDGQEVSITFVDNMLQIRLADGTEFKMPMNKQSSRVRKVA